MLQECLMSDYQRKVSMEYFMKKDALKEATRNATVIPLKPHRRLSIFQVTPESRLHSIEQSGVA